MSQAQADATALSALSGYAIPRHADASPSAASSRARTLRLTPWSTMLLGTAGAAAVAFMTAGNPQAAPGGLAVALRVSIILTLSIGAAYAQTNRAQARMGQVLGFAALFSSVWLLNGAHDRTLFSVGVLFAGAGPVLFAYVMLAHPSGRIESRGERRFLASSGGLLIVAWLVGVLSTSQPPLRTPLLRCVPHCQSSVFAPLLEPGMLPVLKPLLVSVWILLTVGTVALLGRRAWSAPPPLRRCLAPVLIAALAAALLLVTFLALRATGFAGVDQVAAMYVACSAAIPLAVFAGLVLARAFMGQALARLISQFAEEPATNPEALMARALGDSSLQVAYERPEDGTYVDFSGARLEPPIESDRRAVAWIERDGHRIAAVNYDRQLRDQEPFVQAIGAAALLGVERAQLESDLAGSTRELAVSRLRLVETAHAERRRLERDLHDGVQQQLVGLRIKLDVAAETLHEQPSEGERLLLAVGAEMDDVLQALRSLARGIYPSLLSERGLADAIKSAARNSPVPVSVRVLRVGRYDEAVEIAVYYCCLEALQNVVKHAGSADGATVTLGEKEGRLWFEVRDRGRGFEVDGRRSGHGLLNMRDRIAAVGGTVTVISAPRQGTCVRGAIPVSRGPRSG